MLGGRQSRVNLVSVCKPLVKVVLHAQHPFRQHRARLEIRFTSDGIVIHANVFECLQTLRELIVVNANQMEVVCLATQGATTPRRQTNRVEPAEGSLDGGLHHQWAIPHHLASRWV